MRKVANAWRHCSSQGTLHPSDALTRAPPPPTPHPTAHPHPPAPRSYVVNTTLPARVAGLNPKWSDPSTDDVLMQGFLRAVELTGGPRGGGGG
jgi:hypothetical protein